MNQCHYLLLAAAIFCAELFAAPTIAPTSAPLPSSQESKPKDPVKVPQLLLDIYECWNKGGDHCLNIPPANEHVNAVRSFSADYIEKPFEATENNNQRDGAPMETLAFSFNTLAFPTDVVYTTFVRVNRKPLSAEEVELLDCDHSNLKMELYSTKFSNDQEIITLEQSVDLSSANLEEGQWIDFHNLKTMIENARATKSLLNFRLAMGGDCGRISPKKFGVSLEDHPELITYCNSKEEDSVFPALLNEEVQRRKRQIAQDSGSGDEPSKTPESRRPSTLDEIKLSRCQIHDFNVSFADFDWDRYIIIPASYNARFCGGRCNWPLDGPYNTTRHSYIQAVVNFANPKNVPPPCCAPKPETMGRLNVVIKDVNGTFVTRWWDNMIATDCACL